MDELFVWQKNLRQLVRMRDVVILHGNIRDLYIYRDSPHHHEVLFEELIVRLLWPSCGLIRRFDPYYKAAELSLGEGNALITKRLEDFGSPGFNNTVDSTIARVLSDLINKTQRQTWLLKQMHNLLPYRSSYSQEECLRLVAFQDMIEQIAPGNKLIVCYLSDTQVPVELAQQSHRVGFVNIPLPDFEERTAFWSRLIDGGDLSEDLAKLTDGMALTSLRRLVELGKNRVSTEEGNIRSLSFREWERVVSQYKFGETPDYYQQITVERLNKAYEIFTKKEGVQGQDHAIGESIKMLWKARANVSPLLRTGPSSAPRGNLFFCGPSGTGKTMLAKKIAKFVFGSEEAFCRIDMSEYQQDFTVSKLIGAPPGYVGYEAGGILTNAMIEKPFSVVLFDEIEKAHPRVFDLFLQILSDGRLTDSRGQTVFFSQAIIIFTSNIGTRAIEAQELAEAQQSGNADRVREHFVNCVRRFFRYEISRPELLNRIGNNIVPFNFLDGEDVLVKAVLFYLDLLKFRFEQEYSERRLSLRVDRENVALFIVQNYSSGIREFGGRAVINTLDDKLLPELAQQLLELEMAPPARPTVISIDVGMRDGYRQICVHV